ncbi:hypothetical protein EV175_004188 [Coemansia sp. RSA 1933]|nr:hypothetical protein EV175_004188 [Coemansia sp. RSA 1933]
MESAFGRMFRKSKLAGFDRSIKQIYATYPEAAARGEWGLKRPLPSKVITRLATFKEIDSKEQITDFEAANQQYMLTMTWRENFPESQSPKYAATGDAIQDMAGIHDTLVYMGAGSSSIGASETTNSTNPTDAGPERNINTMSRAEWTDFLEEARSRRSEWKESLEMGKFAPEETMAFMNATDKLDSTNDGIHRLPTYHDYVPSSEELVVKGRVLNRVAAGYAVGVQGIVGYLPLPANMMDSGYLYRDVKTFYVHSAKFDNQGRPVVLLGLKPRGTRGPSYDFGSRATSAFSHSSAALANRAQSSADKKILVDRLKGILARNRELAKSRNTEKTEEPGTSDPAEGSAGETNPFSDTLDILDKTRHN